MTVWSDCKNIRAFGIAKCNFVQDNKPHRLNIDVGDAVVILKETTYWFYGYKQKEKETRGIFPKTYIHLCDYIIVNDEYCIKRTDIVEEITKVLFEWGAIAKRYYLATHTHFQTIRTKMNELNNNRALLVSGNLPVDEARKVKLKATSLIDTGNNLLGLDMVVRDDSGDILDTNTICTTELYEHHLSAVDRINKANRPQQRQRSTRSINKFSHNILLHVNAFVCKFQDDSDLLFTLFDGESHKPISENYVVKWSRNGIARDIDQFDNNRVLFADLSKNDLSISKIYLVCYAIRIGSMEMKDDSKRISITNSMLTNANKKHSQLSINSNGSCSYAEYIMRRPFGVACTDLTPIIKKPDDFRGNLDLPFIMCEKETLDGTLRKLISNKDMGKMDSKMAVTVEVLRGDIKQIKEEFPRLVHTNVPVARKMGFPEVILPGDVRNDLYVTLCNGEFSRIAKTSEKNVEVTVCVCNDQCEIIPGVISVGVGHESVDEYKSVVYYHDDKPKWLETFKIHVPIEDFKQSHLRFTLKHRSSNEQKDKSEKPFAMAYVRLMQPNGTTITQGQHALAVYKIDHKKFDKTNKSYMDLPAETNELFGAKPTISGLSLLQKDHLTVVINLCSTKLTQSVSLLGLLNWSAHKETLEESLYALSSVPGEEVVKFLQDILDALFNILVDNDNPTKYDQLVFMSIIHLIETVSDLKYQHFLSVLDVYINESFSATLAYTKLIDVLQRNITDAIEPNEKSVDGIEFEERVEVKRLYKTTRYLHYVMKFVIRSRVLYTAINDNLDYDDFANRLHELLETFIRMIGSPSDLLKSEGALLKNLHIIATDLMEVFDPERLTIVIVNILKKFPPRRLTQSKMGCIKDFVETKLFTLPECRAILLPVFCKHIKDHLESKEEGDLRSDIWHQEKNLSKAAKVLGQLKAQLHTRETTAKQKIAECISIMNRILKLLYRKDIGPTHNDIRDIMIILLRTVMKVSHVLDRESQLVGNFFAIMLGILQRMDRTHYDIFVKKLNNRLDLRDFLIETMLVFEELVSPHQKHVFPRDWMDMIMHQNTVILHALQHLTVVINDHFFDPFEKQVWSNFFQCSISFLIQSPLQLNDFNDNKRQVVFARYRDIRKDTAHEIRKMWFQLGAHKPKFVPQLVEPTLEMSMIPEIELRRATIPIFFDMIQCEYYSSKITPESYGDTKRNNTNYKANFNDFEMAMIEKLDILIGAGKGDIEYKFLFEEIMLANCEAHNILNVEGSNFVNMVSKLMDKLLEYRYIIQDESKENRMACTFSLLQFYKNEVNRNEMYIRYVYKLCDLHMEFDNYTEAAFTLTLHTDLLQWNDTELSPLLRSHRHNACRTHRELKEVLYYEIIDYFDKGKMWECAIAMCKVLAHQYEHEIYDYLKLAEILNKMAHFYEQILKELRHTSEYFRVCFYGLGFPRIVQNKVYIFRGKEYERLSEFCTRILVQYPQAELMQTLEPPGEDVTLADGQYIQINKVEPIMDDAYTKFNEKNVSHEIVKYFRSNNVQEFKFSRPYRESNALEADDVRNLWLERTKLTTEYPLPGILRWFPVIESKKFKISPIELAVETMKSTNKEIRDLIIQHKNDENIPVNPLSMKINGIVDPAVMGGFSKYENAFLTNDYVEERPDDKYLVEELKDLIASQIPMLEIAIALHKQKAPESLKLFHDHLETCFADMQQHVESRYGRKTCDIKLDRESVVLRRNASYLPTTLDITTNRLSETSMGSSDSGLSKSTFLPRPQTSSIKSTLASFNFNSRPNLGHSPSTKIKGKNKTPSKRGSIKKDRDVNTTNSQWYTAPLTTISSTPEKEVNTSISSITSITTNAAASTKVPDPRVLTEELTSKRPLRSEMEKERRLSRPASIATPTSSTKHFIVNEPRSLSESSNRNSVETTDSTSDEDLRPPPLPAKTRDSTDFSSLQISDWNLNDYTIFHASSSATTSITNVTYEYVEAKNSAVGSSDSNKPRPPTPPPKPFRNSKHIP